jgi:hypothetical protein
MVDLIRRQFIRLKQTREGRPVVDVCNMHIEAMDMKKKTQKMVAKKHLTPLIKVLPSPYLTET